MSGTGENVKLLLEQYFECARFNLRERRSSCAKRYALARHAQAGVRHEGMPSTASQCRGCPIGAAHTAGRMPPIPLYAPAVDGPVPATDVTRKLEPRRCICGEPLGPGRPKFCSYACASSKDRPEPEDSWAASTITAPMSAGARERW